MAYSPSTNKATLEVSDDGGASYKRLFNYNDLTFSGGDREENEIATVDEPPIVSTGSARNKDVSVTVNASAGTEGYRIVKNAYDEGNDVRLRLRTPYKEVFDNAVAANTLEIAATTGDVTGVNTQFLTDPNFETGRGIMIGGVLFIIESITSATELAVSRADGMDVAAVAATDGWDIVDYGVELVADCQVLNAGNYSIAAASPFQDSLTLKTTKPIGDVTFITS